MTTIEHNKISSNHAENKAGRLVPEFCIRPKTIDKEIRSILII